MLVLSIVCCISYVFQFDYYAQNIIELQVFHVLAYHYTVIVYSKSKKCIVNLPCLRSSLCTFTRVLSYLGRYFHYDR